MSDLNIECPHCHESFELTEAIAAPIVQAEREKALAGAARRVESERATIVAKAQVDAAAKFADQLRESEAALAQRDAQVEAAKRAEMDARQARAAAEQAQRDIALTVRKQVDAEKAVIEEQTAQRVHEEVAAQLKAAENAIATKDSKLKAAETAELQARASKAEAEDAMRQLELTVARRLDEERAKVHGDAEARFAEHVRATQAQLEERDAQVEAAKQAELAARQARAAAEQAQRDIALSVRAQVDTERAEIERQTAERVQSELAVRLKAADDALVAKDVKLKFAEAAELEARRLKADAEEAIRQTDLTVARRLDEERMKVRETALKERDEDYRLKLADKDTQLRAMQEQIEDLRRTGIQTQSQLTGEVLELDLLEVLQQAFPRDGFDRISKGQRGGDVVQIVRTASGSTVGQILWESKRTQRWSDTWLAKTRDDQRAAKCDLAAIVTETLPDGIAYFDQIEGVWVSGVSTVVPMAAALRQGLIELARARRAAAGADTKKDLVYSYLTGMEFRSRVCSLIEPLVDMRSELDREKRLLTKQWSAREKQLERCTMSLTGLYGDLQGLMGSTLPQIEGLDPALEEQPRLAIVGMDIESPNFKPEV